MKIVIVGGAGFIGSNLVSELLRTKGTEVFSYDNFSSGREWHFEQFIGNPSFKSIRAEISDTQVLLRALLGADIVYHLASNPDISLAASEPSVDFDRGTLLSHLVFECARKAEVRQIVYASGSGVFGDDPTREFTEESISPRPTSTYAASKIAGEALLSAYSSMFNIRGLTFRFANVVGPNQTHGVGFDFIRKLKQSPRRLHVLGDGTQSKSYIHVSDVVAALTSFPKMQYQGYNYFNLCTGDYITVKQIAKIVIEEMGLTDVAIEFGTSPKGWAGDVPVIRFSSEKARQLGWRNHFNSEQAIRRSIVGMLTNIENGNILPQNT